MTFGRYYPPSRIRNEICFHPLVGKARASSQAYVTMDWIPGRAAFQTLGSHAILSTQTRVPSQTWHLKTQSFLPFWRTGIRKGCLVHDKGPPKGSRRSANLSKQRTIASSLYRTPVVLWRPVRSKLSDSSVWIKEFQTESLCQYESKRPYCWKGLHQEHSRLNAIWLRYGKRLAGNTSLRNSFLVVRWSWWQDCCTQWIVSEMICFY